MYIVDNYRGGWYDDMSILARHFGIFSLPRGPVDQKFEVWEWHYARLELILVVTQKSQLEFLDVVVFSAHNTKAVYLGHLMQWKLNEQMFTNRGHWLNGTNSQNCQKAVYICNFDEVLLFWHIEY